MLRSLVGSEMCIRDRDLALVCAAAYSGAVTRTLSPTLLVLELTNRSGDLSIGTGLAVMTAYAVASRIAPSIYRSHELLSIPHMPEMPPNPNLHAADVMSIDVQCVSLTNSRTQVALALGTGTQLWFPCVDQTGHLLGEFFHSDLTDFTLSCSTEEHGHDLGGWVSQQEGSLDRTLCHTHLQLSPNAPAVLVHRVFKMLGPGAVYVTDAGLLKGAIFKQALVTHGYKATLTD
eukprot:TRINITY_DN36190_c0_g1_i3.p1 TRINITY_DN36190_c0_g1~~TRINITY_DN36190_c0_g1_i3.p1  ORF type:complete len:232 (+),score=35.75 TRINITY_DN36190_c0_g1_i3:125-820(+)